MSSLRKNTRLDDDTVISADTIATFNDRDILRRASELSSHPNRLKKMAKVPSPSSYFQPNLRRELLHNEGGSEISNLTWLPAAPRMKPRMSTSLQALNEDPVEQNGMDIDPNFNSRMPRAYSTQRTNSSGNYVKFGSGIGRALIQRELSESSVKTFDFTADFEETIATLNEEVYFVKQSYGYFAILFSIIQVFVLAGMTAMCGIAPIDVNPMIGPYPDSLSLWGAKNAYAILVRNEWWRPLSGSMLHVGVVHLFCNAAVQLETAAFFEREWGSLSWLAVYISSAYGSTISACIMNTGSISVVSSGSVMGLFGAKLAEVLCRSCEKTSSKQQRISKQVRLEQLSGIFCSVAIVGLFSFVPFIDWSAHAGGLITGFLTGFLLFASSIRPLSLKIPCLFLGFFGTASVLYFSVMNVLSRIEPAEELADVCEYYQRYFWDDYACSCR